MKKSRVRGCAKGEFDVRDSREVEARARCFIGKAIIIAGLGLLIVAATYFALSGNGSELRTVLNSVVPLMTFVLGYYFKSDDG
jgi:hypothetical protein